MEKCLEKAIDIDLLKLRGANLCGDDKFDIVSADCCQQHYLFNVELKDIYFDPFDLSKRFFFVPALVLPPCAACGALNWQPRLDALSLSEKMTGCWGWIYQD